MTGKNNTFGYTPEQGKKEERYYYLSDNNWVALFIVMFHMVKHGANPSLYTSREGNALCISVKHGDTRVKYWVGPDDDASDVIRRIEQDWNIPVMAQNPVESWLSLEIEREKAFLESLPQDTPKDT